MAQEESRQEMTKSYEEESHSPPRINPLDRGVEELEKEIKCLKEKQNETKNLKKLENLKK